jgi:hypothetical protein
VKQPLSVTSNAIRDVQYKPEERHLEIEFHNGRRYRLEGVPQRIHYLFMNADSVGSFFNRNLRGQYKTVELNQSRDSRGKDEEPEV